MAHQTGESKQGCLRVDFDRRLKLEFHGSKVTTDAGLLAYRELDASVELTAMAGDVLADSRTGKNGRHGMVGQFRQSVFGRLGGYDDVNDADRLSLDPVMRWIVGGHAVTKQAASSSRMGRFETEVLATEENLAALGDLSGRWIDRVHDRCPPKKIILDMDSSVSPTTVLRKARPTTALRLHLLSSPVPVQPVRRFGTVRPASRQRSQRRWLAQGAGAGSGTLQGKGFASVFRGDAAFASPDIYEFLEDEGFLYAIRLPKNQVLLESICHLLTRPVGRPPNHVRRYYASFSYRAKSWDKARRVVAKVEWHPSELFPRVGFIVTNLSRSAERVTLFYNQRGKAEQCIKERQERDQMDAAVVSQVPRQRRRLQLHALAYHLANFMRTLALPKEVEHWSLTTLREKLVKIGAKVVSHGRYVTFQLAEVAVQRELFRKILSLIDDLRPRPAPA